MDVWPHKDQGMMIYEIELGTADWREVCPTSSEMVWAYSAQAREAPVHSGRLKRADNVKRSRGRPNLTGKESVKRDLKDRSITRELAIDRGAWKLAIHVSEPWVGCEILWVSPLAYPNLFGTKGFVVVVVGHVLRRGEAPKTSNNEGCSNHWSLRILMDFCVRYDRY